LKIKRLEQQLAQIVSQKNQPKATASNIGSRQVEAKK
jgi:hypothetical protein